MDTSLRSLEEALSIRRQIGSLEKRLASILRVPSAGAVPRGGPQRVSAATRARLAAAARARWTRLRTPTRPAPARKKGELTPAGRRRLSQLMKARWAARRKAAGTKTAPTGKKGGITSAGRKRLSQLMKARWAARRKAPGKT
jgi:hypothetical protein